MKYLIQYSFYKIVFVLFCVIFTSSAKANSTVDLKILATTDVHGSILNYDYFQSKTDNTIGLNRLSSLVKQYRAENPSVILLDNGDFLQGNPFAEYAMTKTGKEKNAIIRVMEQMHYDVINLGNHEFNYGLEKLDQVVKSSKVPIINANIYNADGKAPRFTQYVVLHKQVKDKNGNNKELKVAIIGVVPPQIMMWDKTKLQGKIIAKDMVSEVNQLVNKIKKNKEADLIGVLSHSGITEVPYKKMAENATIEIAKNKNINFIISGHDHGVFPNKEQSSYQNSDVIDNDTGKIRGIPTVAMASQAKYLGVIDLVLEDKKGKWSVKNSKVELVSTNKVDKQIEKTISKEHKDTIKYLTGSLGNKNGGEGAPALIKIDKDLNNYFALVEPDFATSLVNKAVISYIKKDFIKSNPEYKNLGILAATAVFKNGGRGGPNDYTVVKKGNFSLIDVNSVYAFANTIVLLKVKGKDVRELLEWGSQIFNTINVEGEKDQELINSDFRSYNFDVIGGITYEINATKPSRYKGNAIVNKNSYRIENLRYEGKEVKDNDMFIVAVSDYRANTNNVINNKGKNLLFETATDYRDVISSYIKNQKDAKEIYTIDKTWILKIRSGRGVKFSTSIEGRNSIKNNKNIKFIKDLKNGFAIYEYKQ